MKTNREKILFWHLSVAMPYRVPNDSRCPRWGKKVLLNSEQKRGTAAPLSHPAASLGLRSETTGRERGAGKA